MGVFNKKGSWYIDYCYNGRRYREKVGPCKKLAQDVLRKRQIEIAENRFLDIKRDEKIKFDDFAQTYLEQYAKPNKKSWRKSDAISLNHLIPFFGNRYLYEITPLLVEQFKSSRIEKAARATVNRDLACLKCIFNRAIDWGKIKENPVKKVKLFKENNQRLRYLTTEETAILLKNSSFRLKTVILFAINTGMRKGEIQSLKWSDVDFDNEVITLLETKNGEKRHIPMNGVVRHVLESISRHTTSPYIFCDKDGLPYNFRKSFETALKKSAIFNFRFHDLRHSFASHLAMSGVDLNTIRELLGHKSLDMTLRYAHLSKDHKFKAVKVLEANSVPVLTPDGQKSKFEASDTSRKS